jgi:hypothetical protein
MALADSIPPANPALRQVIEWIRFARILERGLPRAGAVAPLRGRRAFVVRGSDFFEVGA